MMLQLSGDNGWNGWTITSYDFNPYPLDDAALFSQAGLPVLATEYGFTLGTPDQMRSRFGGDRAAAVRNGLDRPGQDLEGGTVPRQKGVEELVSSGLLAGVAPWGSPAPGRWSELDRDNQRGITGTPDEAALWSAWADTAASLEAANQSAGPSDRCLSYSSP